MEERKTMIIKPSIRSNVFLNAHPKGTRQFVQSLIDEAKTLPTFEGPNNVLIIGGSSGYGLSSRVALAVSAGANTLNVSFEAAPSAKRTGTAGYYNNIHFQQLMKDSNQIHLDIVADAFSAETQQKTIQVIKESFGKIDLVIYSLAAGARPNPETGALIRSALKPIGQPLDGETIDVATREVKQLHMDPATQEDIDNTIFVMGGSIWETWMHALAEADVLNKGVKTVSYTYVGSGSMDKIYRAGTIGKAKDDLEETALRMHPWLQNTYDGEAIISSSKAVVTKASVFIPGIPAYIACLFEVMKDKGVHESTLKHKHRLFMEMIYGQQRIIDDKHRIRIDHLEMREDVQKETLKKLEASEGHILELQGTQDFIDEFYNIHGFGYPTVNYEEDIELEAFDTSNATIYT